MENSIAVVDDGLFLEHRGPAVGEYGGEHPERPARLGAARDGLLSSAWRDRRLTLLPHDATDEELGRVHTEAYLESLGRTAGREGFLDPDTYHAPGSYAAARRAAGGAVALVDSLLDGTAPFGVALVRPPGHHARAHTAMGFCLLNNVAVAAAHARARGAARVAVIDWDVHHGNGTQEMFYEDPTVLYASLHQFPFYPGTGAASEAGAGDGIGRTLNVPLSEGADDAVYLAAIDRIVAPALSEFDPDLVLVSAGFDAHARDPLASMQLSEGAYGRMTRQLAMAIPRGAPGRLGFVLEGGYDLTALRTSLRATLDALAEPGPSATGGDGVPAGRGDGPLSPRHQADLARAEAAARRHFHLG